MSVAFIRRLADGRVVEKGVCPTSSWNELKSRAPDEYTEDTDNTPLSPIPLPDLPPPELATQELLAPAATPSPTIEELMDAVLAFADGDRAALDAIRAKRRATGSTA